MLLSFHYSCILSYCLYVSNVIWCRIKAFSIGIGIVLVWLPSPSLITKQWSKTKEGGVGRITIIAIGHKSARKSFCQVLHYSILTIEALTTL